MYSGYVKFTLPEIRFLKAETPDKHSPSRFYHPHVCNIYRWRFQCFHQTELTWHSCRPVSPFRLIRPRSPLLYTLFDTMMGPTCKPRFHPSISHSYVTSNHAILIKRRHCPFELISHLTPQQSVTSCIVIKLVELFRGLKMVEVDSHSSHTTLRALESPPSTLPTDNAPSAASKDFSSRTISSTQSEELTSPSTTNLHLPNELIIQILHHALHLRGSSVPPLPVTADRFQSHVSRNGRLARYLVISKSLYPLILEAFYRENEFRCAPSGKRLYGYKECRPRESPIFLPPPHARRHIRRLEFIISLDFFRHDFTSANQWHTLVGLCSGRTGFTGVEFLRLVVKEAPGIHRNDKIKLNRLRTEKFAIRAEKEVVMEGWREAQPFIKVKAEVVKWE
ncbi:hypothetical protein BKA58DRAFT_127553 [Alternaria rosae]|uniref:uncharacterized protein n=1 Tax=Alternaria rosae TaxID=1187941 RepID=UPI001E8CB9C7|nr:uncharacterized protein BKA58DRAFT_127553 [Alternaria rosae]KAH6875739.1 hypothetical protein BKA58DRAFT_127553 [Alternaria rosae]